MKFKTFTLVLPLVLFIILFNGCTQEGAVGPQGEPGQNGLDGLDGQANIYYSEWITPASWSGEAYDWYFDVSNTAINEDVVEAGIILAYMSVPNDAYPSAVRPMPAWAIGANWDYLIPYYGKIEFLCDSELVPGTENYYFRFVLIPPGTKLKSARATDVTKNDLLKMPYEDVCKLLNIPAY